MNDHQDDDREVRAMRELVTELRAQQPPPLDWERVEAELSEQVRQEAELRRRRADRWERNPLLHAAGFAAVAASIGLMLTLPSSPPIQSAAAQPATTTVPLEALRERSSDDVRTYGVASLSRGAAVESDASPVRFVLDGVATWTLAPHSRAIVRTVEMPHVVSLERGSLHAQVVPRGDEPVPVESFAVEAGATRVAVHGTVFSVTRSADEITVEVRRGTVAVGPADHRGLTTGHLLVAPSRAAFSLDGARQARLLAAPRAVASWAPSNARRAEPIAPSGSVETTSPPPRPGDEAHRQAEAPHAVALGDHDEGTGVAAADLDPADPGSAAASDATPALTKGQAQATMSACLGRYAAERGADDSVRVTISSTVRLRLDAERRVIAVQFTPPLKPAIQERCAATVFGRRLTGTADSVQFTVASGRR